MKKVLLFCMLAALLAGCRAQETFEVVEDAVPVEPVAAPMQFFAALPDEAATPTFQDENGGELYVCQDYTISKQILESGDMEKTIRELTGKENAELQILKTRQDTCDRYDFVWTSAGEEGLQLGRACVLDDGNYHYALSTMTQEEASKKLRDELENMFESCSLMDPDINLDTAS